MRILGRKLGHFRKLGHEFTLTDPPITEGDWILETGLWDMEGRWYGDSLWEYAPA